MRGIRLTSPQHKIRSYGYETSQGGTFTIFPLGNWHYTNDQIVGWTRSPVYPTDYPCVLKNISDSLFNNGSGLIIPAGGIDMAPGMGNERASLRFTAPEGGTYAVNGSFSANQNGMGDITTTDVHLLVNDHSVWDADVKPGSLTQSFSQSVTLSAGGTLDFLVGYGGNGAYGDSVGLAAQVALVPEPGTAVLALLGSSIALLCRGVAWKR